MRRKFAAGAGVKRFLLRIVLVLAVDHADDDHPAVGIDEIAAFAENLERLGLGLKFAETILEGAQFGLQRLDLLARLLLCTALFLVAGIELAQLPADFLLQVVQLLPGLEPLPAGQRQGGNGDGQPWPLATGTTAGHRGGALGGGIVLGCHCGQL